MIIVLIRIRSAHFCAGYDTELRRNGIAPIIAYMRGWQRADGTVDIARVRAYCARKRWQVEVSA